MRAPGKPIPFRVRDVHLRPGRHSRSARTLAGRTTAAMWPAALSLALLVASAPTAVSQEARTSALAFTHVGVVDVESGRVLPDRTVVIAGNRIRSVEPSASARVPVGARVVDGRGKYLIPGLWDMHAHLGSDRVTRGDLFPLFVANGVTGIRDMWGDCDSVCMSDERHLPDGSVPAPVVREWKRDLASGSLIGPRLVAASAFFDGPAPMFPGSYAIDSAEEGRRDVRLAKAHGADFIKVLSLLPRDAYFAILDEARAQGLPVSGHIPIGVSSFEASDSGQRSIEHLNDLLGLYSYPSCSGDVAAVQAAQRAFVTSQDTSAERRAELRRGFSRALMATFDAARCDSLFDRFARNGTWRVPTMLVMRNMFAPLLGDTVLPHDPRLRYMDAPTRADWVEYASVSARNRATGEDSALLAGVLELEFRLVGRMQRAGVPLMAGPDDLDKFVIPGFALHDEIALMAGAGLTPLEALRAATLNPARYLDATDSLGTVAAGKLADLVLLDANPLEDIANTQAIRAVVLSGRYLDREALDGLLAEAERFATTSMPPGGVDAPGPRTPNDGSMVVADVHVFDPGRGRFSGIVNVVIQDGVIQAVDTAGALPGATRIDGDGAYVLPGLWDSHVHLAFATLGGADTVAAVLNGFVRHGVLYVRDVGGPTAVMAHMRAMVDSGQVMGPEIFFAGPMAEHSPLVWAENNKLLPDFTVPMDRPEQVDSLVGSVAAAGGSLLKAFGKWDLDLLRRLLREARQHSMPVVLDPGPPLFQSVPVDTALALGITSIEHAMAPWQAALRPDLARSLDSLMHVPDLPDSGRMDFVRKVVSLGRQSLDEEHLRQLAQSWKQHGAVFTPTLRVVDAWQREPPAWSAALSPEERRRFYAGMWDATSTMTLAVASAGVPLLVGQDGLDPAGAAEEMSVLARIGIAPATLLQAATINPARWFGLDDQLGSVEPGRRGDLVLLRQNPLETIEAVRTPWMVIRDGVVVFQDTLGAAHDADRFRHNVRRPARTGVSSDGPRFR